MHETPPASPDLCFFGQKKPQQQRPKQIISFKFYMKNREERKYNTKKKLFYTVTHFSFWPRCQQGIMMGKVEILGLEIWQNFKFSHLLAGYFIILLICLLAEVDEEDSCPPDLEAVELQQQQQQQRQQQQQFEKLQQQQQVIFVCEIETGL